MEIILILILIIVLMRICYLLSKIYGSVGNRADEKLNSLDVSGAILDSNKSILHSLKSIEEEIRNNTPPQETDMSEMVELLRDIKEDLNLNKYDTTSFEISGIDDINTKLDDFKDSFEKLSSDVRFVEKWTEKISHHLSDNLRA